MQLSCGMSTYIRRRTTPALTAAVALLTPAACLDPNPSATERVAEGVKESPLRWAGESVVLQGEVGDVHGDRAFELESDGGLLGLGDPSILVVTKSPVQLMGRDLEDEDVLVRGTIRYLVVAELERELGWDLEPELEAELKDRPAVVADRIERYEPQAVWQEGVEPRITSFTVVTVTNPLEALAGQRVDFEYVPVREVDEVGTWIGYQDSRRLLVVPTPGKSLPAVGPDDIVEVEGILRELPSPAIMVERYGVDPDRVDEMRALPLFLEANHMAESVRTPELTRVVNPNATAVAIAYDPARRPGARVTGTSEVREVISDRAFWLDTDAEDPVLGIVREDVPQHEMIDIDAGQTITFEGRLVRGADVPSQIDGPLEQDALQAISKTPNVIAMHWRDVDIRAQP